MAQSRPVVIAAAVYLVFGFTIALTWQVPGLANYVPKWFSEWMYPIDAPNLDVLRFAHFLALTTLALRYIPRDWAGLASPAAWPVILCGQHSLEVFCLGIFLSFAGHFAMVEISSGIWMQLLVTIAGISVMVAFAGLINWY